MPERRNRIWITIAAIAIAGIIVGSIAWWSTSNHQETVPPPPYTKIELDRFPISLPILFDDDNLTAQQAKVNGIVHGQTEQSADFFEVYPNYFHYGHEPATFKWYMYVYRFTPISLPVDSYLTLGIIRENKTVTINGSIIDVDIQAQLHLSYYITVCLDHACINQSLVLAFNNASVVDPFGQQITAVHVPKDAIFGYTPNNEAIDFAI
ncbi:MAG TPA: hypothetical protein VKM55_29610 [Candidatus Lokiarchaeia archaeon]|nr:hypothetical protein [Candidatus Lokiarchaeia archaeon]